MRPRRSGSSNSPRAFTLVEALVAMAVLSAGVIGVVEVFSMSASTTGRSQRLSQAVQIAQRELAMAMTTTVRPREGAKFPHRWRVQRQDRPMGLERIVVRVYWNERGLEREYRLEQLCIPRARTQG